MDTQPQPKQKTTVKQKLLHIYATQYKKLLIVPMIILILSIIQIGVQTATTGDFVNKGVSLKGGSIITLFKTTDPTELQSILNQKLPTVDLSVRTITESGEVTGLIIESAAQSEEELDALLTALKEQVPLTKEDYTTEITGSSIGADFFRQTFTALIIAFILMSIVVFAYFRTPIPSAAVVFAAFSDMVITVAGFNLTGMNLTPAGIAALLMLIGYSVDTDILLTSRVLRNHEGTVLDRTLGAIKTGMIMTSTTIAAVIVALIVTNNDSIRQIMVILLIGLIADIINTWIQNAAILRIYMERKYAQTNA